MHSHTFLQSAFLTLCVVSFTSAYPAPALLHSRPKICAIAPNACYYHKRDIGLDLESRIFHSSEILAIRNDIDNPVTLVTRKVKSPKISAQVLSTAKAIAAKVSSYIPGLGGALSAKMNANGAGANKRDLDEEPYLEAVSREWDTDDLLEMRDSEIDLEERVDWLEFDERDEILDELD
ncbi:hypothetical protein BDQ17DRAFT_1517749 [Cyathus striatus]|nr:hypothetical protein BDQ17DRAFT_1517749 [Cyathus striatus]